jgi:hypothetical protein
MAAKGAKTAALDKKGIASVCDDIVDKKSLTQIAHEAGVSTGMLLCWIEADPERSARAREARALTARLWDERAETVVAAAEDPFQLARAKELAHHYRWRASKIAPRDYGDKQQVEHSGNVSVTRKVFTADA